MNSSVCLFLFFVFAGVFWLGAQPVAERLFLGASTEGREQGVAQSACEGGEVASLTEKPPATETRCEMV